MCVAPRPEDLPLPKFLSLNRTPPPTPPLETSSGTVQPSKKHFGLTKEVTMKETSKKDAAAPKKPRPASKKDGRKDNSQALPRPVSILARPEMANAPLSAGFDFTPFSENFSTPLVPLSLEPAANGAPGTPVTRMALGVSAIRGF